MQNHSYISIKKNHVVAMVLAVTFIAFINTLSFDFTNSDEETHVVLNTRIRDLSLSGIVVIFSSMDLNLYTPLTTLSFALDYAMWGLNPFGYHAVNLLLHLLNTWLVFLFCLRWSGRLVVATIASCLFGVHPVHVESVAWIVERKDLLFTAFAMSSLLFFENYQQKPEKRLLYAASVVTFICSLLSKPQAAALPVIMLLMDHFRGIEFRHSLGRIWPFLLLSFAICGMTLIVSVFSFDQGNYSYSYSCAWWNRPFVVTYGICFYIVKLIWPFGLPAVYECSNEMMGVMPLFFYLSVFGVIFLIVVVWQLWHKRRDLIFGVLFFFLILLPVIQIVPFGQVFVAERYAYMSSVGMLLFAGQLAGEFINRHPACRYHLFAAIILVVIGMVALTYERNKIWKDGLTLNSAIISRNPNVALAFNNRGVARFRLGDTDGAHQDYNQAVRLDPLYAKAFFNRGILRSSINDISGAVSDYSIAIAIDSRYAEAYHNRALLLELQGETNAALRDFSSAVLYKPDLEPSFVLRGVIMAEQRRYDRALADFKRAIVLNPTNAAVYFNMGKVYLEMTNYAAARLCFENAKNLGLRIGSSQTGNSSVRH